MGSQKAREGICLLLNNDCVGAERVFKDECEDLEMATGKCFVTFISALLSYETEKLEDAVQSLQELEGRCSPDANTGWIKSVKNRVFGSSFNLSDPDLAEKLQEQIIFADTQVCVALLTFLQQDISSYIKGGWKLRRAWKVYQTTYSFILDLYKQTFPSKPAPGSEIWDYRVVTQSVSCDLLSRSDCSVLHSCNHIQDVSRSKSQPRLDLEASVQPGLLRSSLSYISSFVLSPSVPVNSIPAEVVARLMSAVSFGFGIFQLCVSLVPPSLLRIIHLLGFDGDRQTALNALMFARHGDNLRGPLALLALLWFHTIVRPFLALDGSNVKAGVDIANQLYEESKREFSKSALFLFFLGRIQRLKSNIPESLRAYEEAIERSPQREVQLLCLHEIGWCYLILHDWSDAYLCFDKLRDKSRWSKLFYTYLAAVSTGANDDIEKATFLIRKLPKWLPEAPANRSTLETFIARRVRQLSEPISRPACVLLCFELLYLWNALPSSNTSAVLNECKNITEEPMVGMKSFIEGVVHTYNGELELAEYCYRQTLESRSDIHNDPEDTDGNDDHVTAFASLELGTLLISVPQTEKEGRKLLTDTRDNYNGYDFENKVTIRIHAALKQ